MDEILRYFKVGEEITLEIQLNGKYLYKEMAVVTETSEPTCEGCMFVDKGVGCYELACTAGCRYDGRNVIFQSKRIEKVIK